MTKLGEQNQIFEVEHDQAYEDIATNEDLVSALLAEYWAENGNDFFLCIRDILGSDWDFKTKNIQISDLVSTHRPKLELYVARNLDSRNADRGISLLRNGGSHE